MSDSNLTRLRRLMNYERQQYDALVMAMANQISEIEKVESQLRSLDERQHDVLLKDNNKLDEIQSRLTQQGFCSLLERQIEFQKVNRTQLNDQLKKIEAAVRQQRARLKSIEHLIEKKQLEHLASLQHRSNVELSDMVLTRLMEPNK